MRKLNQTSLNDKSFNEKKLSRNNGGLIYLKKFKADVENSV